MKDYISVGPCPTDEECVQLGDENYYPRARKECARFIEVIRKKLGAEPENCRLATKSFQHDFGSYLEVVCFYDDEDSTSEEYAYKCESETPTTWNG